MMVRWELRRCGLRGSGGVGSWETAAGDCGGLCRRATVAAGGGRELRRLAAVLAWWSSGVDGWLGEWRGLGFSRRVGGVGKFAGLFGWASRDSAVSHPSPAYFRDKRENRVPEVNSRITHYFFGFPKLLPEHMIGFVGFGTFGFGNG